MMRREVQQQGAPAQKPTRRHDGLYRPARKEQGSKATPSNEFIALWRVSWALEKGRLRLPIRIRACTALGSLSSVVLSSAQTQ
jgi:hypothetical protein